MLFQVEIKVPLSYKSEVAQITFVPRPNLNFGWIDPGLSLLWFCLHFRDQAALKQKKMIDIY